MRYGALRITIIYILISLLWITFSDQVLFLFEKKFEHRYLLMISSVKGYFFVIANGVFLYFIIKSDDKKLVESEQQYRAMYEANPNPMWIYDLETLRFQSVNNSAVSNYGYSRDEFLKMSILDIRPAGDAETAIESAKRVANNYNQTGIWRHIKKDGTMIYVNITSHKITFNNQPHVLVMIRDTTEKILFEQKLEKIHTDLEEEKRKLTETQLISKVAGWEYCLADKKLIWSDELYKITGIKPDDTRDVFDIYVEHIHPDDRPMMIKAMDELIKTGKDMDVTHRITSINNETRFIRQLARLEHENGCPKKVVGSMQDITEIKLLEQDRNRQLYNFENTLNSISDAFFALNYEMQITRINETFRKLVNKKSEDIIGQSIFIIFPKKVNKFYHVYEKALNERVIAKEEEFSIVLNKWVRVAAYPTEEGVAVYFSDITENKLKDIQLKEAVERYDLVAQATKDVIYDLDIVNNHLIYNTSLTQLINVPFEQIEYNLEWWRSRIHPDDVQEVVQSQEKVSRERKTNWECEYRIDCGNGNYRYVMDQGYFIFNNDKEPVRLIGAIRDIDALKRSNEENKRLASIITRVNNMIVVTDREGKVTWINKAFEDFTGFRLEEIYGHPPSSFLHGSETDHEQIAHNRQKQNNRESFAADLIKYTKFGEPFWVTAEFTPVFDDNNNYMGYIAVYQNITLRKQKEQEVNRQNNVLREVAWISSHEVRRPVATIMGLIYLINITENLQEKEELIALVSHCADELDQIVHNIHDKINEEMVH